MRLPWQPKAELVEAEERADGLLSIDQYLGLLTQFSYQGVQYTLPGAQQEEIGGGFEMATRMAYKQSGVVFACVVARMLLFSEMRFQWRRIRNGRPGELFGTNELALLENPWANGTTGDLLMKALQYADLGGNFFVRRKGQRLKIMRPDWVSILMGSNEPYDGRLDGRGAWELDSEVIGYVYTPGGPGRGGTPEVLDVDEVAHWAPLPDPEAEYRGMSWITPVVREIMADKAATEHKLHYFENGATPNMIVKMEVGDPEQFKQWIEVFRERYEGVGNAYKTMFLGAGHDATPVGSDFQQVEFKATQGAGETRIAAAARVPPIIVGLSEGLQAATYSNYGMARRAFADATMRPLWRSYCSAMQKLVTVPGGAMLWYDDRDISFLQDDAKEAAEIVQLKATAIKTLVDAGFEPGTAVDAVDTLDLSLLNHSGLVSVQLQPPGTKADEGDGGGEPPPEEPPPEGEPPADGQPSTNGKQTSTNGKPKVPPQLQKKEQK